jgi:hypothetical protein
MDIAFVKKYIQYKNVIRKNAAETYEVVYRNSYGRTENKRPAPHNIIIHMT